MHIILKDDVPHGLDCTLSFDFMMLFASESLLLSSRDVSGSLYTEMGGWSEHLTCFINGEKILRKSSVSYYFTAQLSFLKSQ